ncbi:MAG: diaminopimelate decarboxylase [Bacteroidales bacterium]|jgi:diaminopimelate decarboxylase|nr:diaminopimelate decarboxylase [Bacteroidales bacterium]
MITQSAISAFQSIETPFYYYDMELLNKTLDLYTSQINKYGYHAHYALKANANPRILEVIQKAGFGADCVSGNEVALAVKSGFAPEKIVYAGVGKSDKEIKTALKSGIFSFNCESVPEIKIINDLAAGMGKVAHVALRINPDIDAHTHKYISTGLKENKFGISPWMFESVVNTLNECKNVKLIGLHFHVGSQILDLSVFKTVCTRVAEIQQWFTDRGIFIENLNLGGGLGVDYENPNANPIASFKEYFEIINKNLVVAPGQNVHFEPGRAIVAQCGHLISRVLYVKIGQKKKFAILDCGMNDLIRPALYQAHHAIENLTSTYKRKMRYDVVGPVCESSDQFGKNIVLPQTSRGDLIALHTAGAYGQVMAMKYNQRDIAKAYYSTDLI